jgi:hypothetical protein
LNIDNFVNTFNYNNVVLREKLFLFLTYIEFFHKLHTKYFKRFTTKMHLFISQINHDIKFEDTDTKEDQKQSLLMEFKNDEIDDDLIYDLNHIINDSSDSESLNNDFVNICVVTTELEINKHIEEEEEPIKEEPIKEELIIEELIIEELIIEEPIKEEPIIEIQKKKRGRKPILK